MSELGSSETPSLPASSEVMVDPTSNIQDGTGIMDWAEQQLLDGSDHPSVAIDSEAEDTILESGGDPGASQPRDVAPSASAAAAAADPPKQQKEFCFQKLPAGHPEKVNLFSGSPLGAALGPAGAAAVDNRVAIANRRGNSPMFRPYGRGRGNRPPQVPRRQRPRGQPSARAHRRARYQQRYEALRLIEAPRQYEGARTAGAFCAQFFIDYQRQQQQLQLQQQEQEGIGPAAPSHPR